MRDLIASLLPVLLPLLRIRGGLPTLLALAALGWLLYGLIQMGLIFHPGWRSDLFGQDPALHDTYYVVGHFHYLFGFAVVLGLLALVARFTAPANKREKTAFWTLQISLALALLPQLILGLRYTSEAQPLDLARQFETVNLLNLVGSLFAFVSALTLICLLAIRLIRRLGRH